MSSLSVDLLVVKTTLTSIRSLTLALPYIFDAIGEGTLYVFGAVNTISIPIGKITYLKLLWRVVWTDCSQYGLSIPSQANVHSRRLICSSLPSHHLSGTQNRVSRHSWPKIQTLVQRVRETASLRTPRRHIMLSLSTMRMSLAIERCDQGTSCA